MAEKRLYETTFIVNAALEDQDIDAVVSKVTGYVENHGGTTKEVSRWGRRRLAYPINKKFNGYYVHFTFEILPENMPVIDRFLVLEDTVLRHLILQLDQKLIDVRSKRAEEKKKAKEGESQEAEKESEGGE